MKTDWESGIGRYRDYIRVTRNEVVVGHTDGTGMGDMAGACSHKEFLDGRFHDTIIRDFGKEVLDEAIEAVNQAPSHPPFTQQEEEVQVRKKYIDAIPIDEDLKYLYSNPKTQDGFTNYGNRGSYKTYIESETVSIFYESTHGYIQAGESQIPLEFNFHASSGVELHDHFFIIGDNNLIVISPHGEIVFNSEQDCLISNLNEPIFGSWVRMNRVYRNDESIFVKYWWFNNEYNEGLLKFELDKGFTERWELED